jgi:hypothetical protein
MKKIVFAALFPFIFSLTINKSYAGDAGGKQSSGNVCIDIISGAASEDSCSFANFSAATADSLNTGGSGATTVGNATGATGINGSSVNITGTANINTTGSANTNVGNNTGTTEITGSNVNITGTTNINTTGSANTNIGNTGSIDISGGASATQTGSLGISNTGVTSLSSITATGQNAPAMTISGQNGGSVPGTATGNYPLIPNGTGVLITGSGQGGGPDVYIASQNGDAAISVTNTGVRIISPAGTNPGAPINVSSTNTYGVAGANNTGSVVNNFGTGGSGTSGIGGVTQTTTNNIGGGGGSNSQVNNTFGAGSTSSTGLVSNTIGSSVSGGGTVTNSFGGGTGTSNNTFGVNTAAGASSINNLGTTVANSTATNTLGGGAGTTSNNIGVNTASGAISTNNLGVNQAFGSSSETNLGTTVVGSTAINTLGGGAGTTTNSVGNATGVSGVATNSFGNADSIGATSTNTIGGGTGVTTNNMGNNNVNTTIGLTAGNASQSLANGVSTTSVQASTGVGASVLPGAPFSTSANTGIVLNGANGTFATVDVNGKLSMVTGTASQSSTSMTITNGLGNVHGLVVNERQATLSGGQNSSSMTLNDNGATFSNPANGAPIQVHGVQDGTSPYDAVNVRQLGRGVAMASALAGIPQVDPGKRFNLGLGVGNFMSENAMAIGGSIRFNENIVVKAGGSFASGGSNTANGGIGISF